MKDIKNYIIEGLKSVRIEKIIEGKLLDAISQKDYTHANYLVSCFDTVCSNTDDIAKIVVDKIGDENIMDFLNYVEELAEKKYGGNCSEGTSFSAIVSQEILNREIGDGVIKASTFDEELYYIIHTLAVDKYLESKKGKYKEEILDHINNNISRSISLRALFRGDNDKYNKYDPDLYYDKRGLKIVGEGNLQLKLLTACIMIDELNSMGINVYQKMGLSLNDIYQIVESQKDMEKIKLASYYIQSKERGYDIGIDYSKFNDITINDIKEGFSIGENNVKRFSKKLK